MDSRFEDQHGATAWNYDAPVFVEEYARAVRDLRGTLMAMHIAPDVELDPSRTPAERVPLAWFDLEPKSVRRLSELGYFDEDDGIDRLGYVHENGPLVRPTSAAYDAVVAASSFDALEELFTRIGEPYAERFDRFVHSPARETTRFEFDSNVSRLVEKVWLQRARRGHFVTIHGVQPFKLAAQYSTLLF